MKQVPAYVCEKCGYSALGEENAAKVREHERIPTTAKCNSLDGLIVKTGREQDYSVFRQVSIFSPKHEALYTWESYLKQNLKEKKSGLPRAIEGSLSRIFPNWSFTARDIIGTVLYSGKSENTYKDYTELSEAEFQGIITRLKQMYPTRYTNTKFKRKLKYDRQVYHSKR